MYIQTFHIIAKWQPEHLSAGVEEFVARVGDQRDFFFIDFIRAYALLVLKSYNQFYIDRFRKFKPFCCNPRAVENITGIVPLFGRFSSQVILLLYLNRTL